MKIWSCLNGAKVCLEDGNEADDDVPSDDNEGQEARGGQSISKHFLEGKQSILRSNCNRLLVFFLIYQET
jgi:hypothetical protein